MTNKESVELDPDDHVSLRMQVGKDGQTWGRCSCGWVSPDVVGAYGMAIEWCRHLELETIRG